MSNWMGNSYSNKGNYVPHPVPTYTPMGCYRCERCNRLLKLGRECGCDAEDEPRRREVETRKFDFNWHEYGERQNKGRGKNAGNGKRDGSGCDVLAAGDAGARGDRDSRRPGGYGMDGREMKPCPFCGKTYLDMRMAFGKYKVRCKSCGTVYGPGGATADEAAQAWNRRK